MNEPTEPYRSTSYVEPPAYIPQRWFYRNKVLLGRLVNGAIILLISVWLILVFVAVTSLDR